MSLSSDNGPGRGHSHGRNLMTKPLDWSITAKDFLAELRMAGSYILIFATDEGVDVSKYYHSEHKSDILRALKEERKMLGSDLDVKLDRIEDKISRALENDEPQKGMFGFVAFLMRSLGPEDHQILKEFEKIYSADYDTWMQSIMERAGVRK